MRPNHYITLDEWKEDSRRPVWLFDENRRDTNTSHGQTISYVFILVNGGYCIKAIEAMTQARSSLQSGKREQPFKANLLYGSRGKRPGHDPIRSCVKTLLSVNFKIAVLTTSSETVKNKYAVLSGGITPINSTSSAKIRGTGELLPVLNFLKLLANALALKKRTIDVVFDRSYQFGFDPTQRNLISESGTEKLEEVFEPCSFNTTTNGKPSSIQSTAKFRLMPSSDKGSFKDLLLLPETIGYLGAKKGFFTQHDRKILSGEDSYCEFFEGNPVFASIFS